jgi:anti-sigma-K factor RskA
MISGSRAFLRRLLAHLHAFAGLRQASGTASGMPDLNLLAPLLECLPPAPPPPGLLARIEERIDPPATARPRWPLRRCILAAGFSAAAAGAMAVFALMTLSDAGSSRVPLALEVVDGAERVAMLDAGTIDGGRYLQLDHLGLRAPEGNTLDLWLVRRGGRPEFLGMLAVESGVTVLPLSRRLSDGDVLAVSEETFGGATRNGPSGPVILTARVDTSL